MNYFVFLRGGMQFFKPADASEKEKEHQREGGKRGEWECENEGKFCVFNLIFTVLSISQLILTVFNALSIICLLSGGCCK